MTGYDEQAWLELFWSEPTVAEEWGFYMYEAEDTAGNRLLLSFDIYEETCSVSLSRGETALFAADGLTGVRFEVDGECLTIAQKDERKKLRVYFKLAEAISIRYE